MMSRHTITCIALSLALVLLVLMSLMVAGLAIPLNSVVDAVSSLTDPLQMMLVTEVFLPRVLGAIVIGVAFALAGMIIQSLSYNPLATPTILGINEGAILGIMTPLLIASALGDGSLRDDVAIGEWWHGTLGALTVAMGLLILARHDRVGQRLIIIGIAVTALLRALLELLYSQIQLQHATAIYYFSQGDLLATRYDRLGPIVIMLAVILGAIALRYRTYLPTHLEPAAARSLGLDASTSRWLWIVCAAALAGTAVGVAGPVAYIGLMAPIVARWLYQCGVGSMMVTALVGALLMVAADTLGQTLLADSHIAAGTMTSLLGGPFLLGYLFMASQPRRIV